MFALRITTAGRNAAISANNAGASITINRIAIGTMRREPLITHTSMGAEVARVPILRSQQINATTRQLDYEFLGSSNNPGVACNPVGEVGLFLTDGTLFAYWSDTTSIPAAKSTTTTLRGSLFLVLDDLPAGAITIQATRFDPMVVSFAGSGGEGDINITGTLTMVGKRRFRNFYLRAGATLNIDKLLEIECSGEAIFEVGSVVNVRDAVPGAPRTLANSPAERIGLGFNPGINFGGTGGYAQNARRYPPELSPVGSSGQGGGINKLASTVSVYFQTGKGGDAGGSLRVKAQVGIMIGGTFNAQGSDGELPTMNPNNQGTLVISGSGGGSGGSLYFGTPGFFRVDPAMVANVQGGNGSNPIRSTTTPTDTGAAPGSGGTGGHFEAISPNLPSPFPGTINVLGGLSGLYLAGNPTTNWYLAGGTGGAFGGDADTAFASSVQVRQNPGRISLLPILP